MNNTWDSFDSWVKEQFDELEKDLEPPSNWRVLSNEEVEQNRLSAYEYIF